MEWQTLAWVAAIAVLFFVMMRGCGGMAGGCGTGSRRPNERQDADGRPRESADKDKHRAA